MCSQLRPTCPFRPIGIIDESVKILVENPEASSARSVSIVDHTPYKMWVKERETAKIRPLLKIENREAYDMPRQNLPTVYSLNGIVDSIRLETIKENNSMTGDKVYPLIVDRKYFIDIDDIIHWENAEIKLFKVTKIYLFLSLKIELGKAIELTLTIQNKLESLSPSISNINLWPVLRNAIYDNLFHGHFSPNAGHPNTPEKSSKSPVSFLKGIWCYIKSKNLIKNLKKSNNKHLFIFEPDGVEFKEYFREKKYNHYKDPYFEAINKYSQADRLKIIQEPISAEKIDFHSSEETSLYLYNQYNSIHNIFFKFFHRKY